MKTNSSFESIVRHRVIHLTLVGVVLMALPAAFPGWLTVGMLLVFLIGLSLVVTAARLFSVSASLKAVLVLLATNISFWLCVGLNGPEPRVSSVSQSRAEAFPFLAALWYITLFALSIYEGYAFLRGLRIGPSRERKYAVVGSFLLLAQLGTLLYAVRGFAGV